MPKLFKMNSKTLLKKNFTKLHLKFKIYFYIINICIFVNQFEIYLQNNYDLYKILFNMSYSVATLEFNGLKVIMYLTSYIIKIIENIL